jgi:DNA polymerase alpha-associated DNA helicase A
MSNLLDRLTKLVESERASDLEESRRQCAALEPKTLQAAGVCLLNMRVTGMRSGLGGKT